MSQAEELLDSLTEDQIMMRGINPVDEPHIVIESDKTITVPDELKHIAVQGDHNIETVTFDCPRYWDGHDLSQMSMRIVYQRPDGHREPHLVENLRVDEADENTIHFDWTISGNTTTVRGNISFMVCGKLSNTEGVREREWHTRLNQDLIVDEGMDCLNDEIVEQNPDIIEAILVQLDELQNTGVTGLVRILSADPAEPKEGQMWILRTTAGKMTTPVIELGDITANSVKIKLSNASFDGNGAVVPIYNIYVNGVLRKAENIAPGGVCVVTGLSPETEYQISVCGVSGAVLSAMSNVLTATTEEASVPDVPVEIVYFCNAIAQESGGDISLNHNTARATAVYTVGEKACANNNNSDTYYPIPVPADATSCTVVCPNLMWGYNGWNLNNNAYTYDVDSGWKESGVTYTFEAGAAEYVTIGFRKSDYSVVTEEDIANITVTFGTNSEPSEPSEPEVTEQEIVIVPGFAVSVSDDTHGIKIGSRPDKGVAVASSGKRSFPQTVGGVQYYIIEVPKDAVSCKVVCPNLNWGYNGWNTGDDGKLSYDVDSGWLNSGATYTFEAGAAEYVTIGFMRGDYGIVTAEDVSGVTITFA